MNKAIIFLIVVVVAAGVIYQTLVRKSEPEFKTAEVARGQVVQEVSETGQVEKGDKINLNFQLSGTIKDIYLEVGDEVQKGDILAKLDDEQLRIRINDAEAALDLADAQFNKLLAGATPQEIKIAETSVKNAQTALSSAQQGLNDVKAQAAEGLESAYEDSLNLLDDASLQLANSYHLADSVQTTYFKASDQEGIKVQNQAQEIRMAQNEFNPVNSKAQVSGEEQDIDAALISAQQALGRVSEALKTIRQACTGLTYKNLVSSADKTLLETQQGYVLASLTNIVNSQQAVASARLSNQTNVNTAQAKVEVSSGQLAAAQDELDRLKAPPRQEDVNLYQAQVKQARSQITLLENQLEETLLTSPSSGQIVQINRRKGEVVQSALQEPVMVLLPQDPFVIKVDIYEEDVAHMSLGNPVSISLVAFPDQSIEGEVVAIDPAEKMIEGVVYYEVTVDFSQVPEGIKPGMTADLIITTQVKDNVLFVPDEAIQQRDGNTAVIEIMDSGKPREITVELGLKGSSDRQEILSGLSEGDLVVIR